MTSEPFPSEGELSLYRRARKFLRPARRQVGRAITELKAPLRVMRVLPYVWQIERSERREFRKLRALNSHLYVRNGNPLISVVIPTYNRADLLATRSIPSVLAQTYQNYEILVIGDCCSDNTGERLAKFDDPRIKYYNLPERPRYPEDRALRWLIGGYHAINTGHLLAKGLWLANLDDDDVFMPHHLERLLHFCQANDYEFASSQSMMEVRPGEFVIKGKQPPLSMRHKTHSTYFRRTYLRVFLYDYNSWRSGWGLDKYILRKYKRAGVRAGFLEEPTVYYMQSPAPNVRRAV